VNVYKFVAPADGWVRARSGTEYRGCATCVLAPDEPTARALVHAQNDASTEWIDAPGVVVTVFAVTTPRVLTYVMF
jgi:hypothetical protein